MIKNRFKVIFCLFYFICLQSQPLYSEVIRLVTTNWEPYNGENLENYGFTSEIITQAFKRAGYDVTFSFLPWKRAYLMAKLGSYDGLYAAYYSEERAKIFAPSEPYITGPLVLCAKKDRDIQYKSLNDLKPYRIGVVNGYVNTPEFDRADYLTKDGVTSDLLNIRKLIGGRVDLIVIDKYLALYYLNNSSYTKKEIKSVTFLVPPLEEKTLHIMFSRAIPGYKTKLADFNRGLQEIKKEGLVKKIIIRYGLFTDPLKNN